MSHKKRKKSDAAIQPKEESMKDHAGTTGFSGSGYNSKGNADHGKTISNKKRR
ncbi:MAG: hypothetical protein WC635_16385 [Bacteriovorax sp.]|jgi:hypothetical protein